MKLFLVAMLVVVTRTVDAVDLQTKHVCEGEVLRLNCSTSFIKVWHAVYGRHRPDICQEDTPNSQAHDLCRADISDFETMRRCDDQNTCEIKADSSVFGKPCDVKKYLEVTYYCREQKSPLAECRPKTPTYRSEYACDNKTLELKCPSPGEVLKIIDANYGRQGTNVPCPYVQDTDNIFCVDSGSTFERVCLECRGKPECEVPVSSKEFEDHCRDTNKYLSVRYICVSTEREEEDDDDGKPDSTEPQRADSDVPRRTTLMPRRGDSEVQKRTTPMPRRPAPGGPMFFPLKPPGSSFSGKINAQDRDTSGTKFTWGGIQNQRGDSEVQKRTTPMPRRPAPGGPKKLFTLGAPQRAVGGKILTSPGETDSSQFLWQTRGFVNPATGSRNIDGRIFSSDSRQLTQSFMFGSQASARTLTRLGSLFTPAVMSRSSRFNMNIVTSTDNKGQMFFMLSPSGPTQPGPPGSVKYRMNIDRSKIQKYFSHFTFARLLEDYNTGYTFYNREDEINTPFQFTVGNGLRAFFPSVFQMITEVDGTGKSVTIPSSPSSNFQVILEGGNRNLIDYLLSFANIEPALRQDLLEHKLAIPLMFYNAETQRTEEIKLPFYVNYHGYSTTLSSIFRLMSRPTTQFGMKFQITNEDGSKQLMTLPFTVVEYNGKKLLFLTLPTCAAYKIFGFDGNKEYLIDPDGINKGQQPFVVNCNMQTGETVVKHNRMESSAVSYPPGRNSLNVNIAYDGVLPAQLEALRTVSETCQQTMTHECGGGSLHFQNADAKIWWESLDGTKRENWGTETNTKQCHCKRNNACLYQFHRCNCDSGQNTMDSGTVKDKDTLPVAKVVFNKPAASGGQDKLKVGPLKCQGDTSSSTLQFFIMAMQMMAYPGTCGKDRTCSQATCQDYKDLGYKLDGVYVIDPDGSGGEKPFTVYCEMQKTEKAVTIVYHELVNQRTLVDNFELPGSYNMDINYRATMRQINNLKTVSGFCEQSLKYECKGSAFHKDNTLYHWWVSFDGEMMRNWGGAPSNFDGCACNINSTCINGLACNCDKDDNIMRSDSGILNDKGKLPVKQLRFGNTGDANDLGYYTLGPLRCWNNSNQNPEPITELHASCAEVKINNPSALSGNYYIRPLQSAGRFLVYCNMSGPQGITIIYPSSGKTLDIDGFYEEPGTWSQAIRYGPSMNQLQGLLSTSASCKQFIRHGCYGSLHHDSMTGKMYTWWESRTGEKMKYWGDASNGCQCNVDKSCLKGGKCNCDINQQIHTSDEGYLTDKSKLPVSAIRSGDVSDNKGIEYGTATIGPLICQGSSKISSSSRALSKPECETFTTVADGTYHDGLDSQDFTEFFFAVKTSGTAILKLSPYSSSGSAFYKISITNGTEASFQRCRYVSSGEDCNQPQTQMFQMSHLPSSSDYRRFSIMVNDQNLLLAHKEEILTFNVGLGRGLVLNFVAFMTQNDDGKWTFESNCAQNTLEICNGKVADVSCAPPDYVHIVRIIYGREHQDVCRRPGDNSQQDVCYVSGDRTVLCNRDKSRCYFQASDVNLQLPSDCIVYQGYISVTYECRHAGLRSATLPGPCNPNPCMNQGTCTSVGQSYTCTCSDPFEGEHCEHEIVTCTAAGDPHYKDFSKHSFDFQGNCTYVLAKECGNSPRFEVQVVNQSPDGNYMVSSTGEVIILLDGTTIHLKQDDVVIVDGVRMESPSMETATFRITRADSISEVYVFDQHLRVIWNHLNIARVKLRKDVTKDVCGLCGNTHSFPQPGEFRMIASSEPITDPVVFGNSWQVDTATCAANTAHQTAAQFNPSFDEGQRSLANDFCSALTATNALFNKCPKTAAEANLQRSSCVYDYLAKSITNACSIIIDFFNLCGREGGTIPMDAQVIDDCGSYCPRYMTYTDCTPICGATCESLLFSAGNCHQNCLPGCTCPANHYDNGEECVPPEQCGCVYKGRYHKPNSTFLNDDCSEECICQGNNVTDCGLPSSQLCRFLETQWLSRCAIVDGIHDCVCMEGFQPNPTQTNCTAVSMPDMVFPSQRRRRRRDLSATICKEQLGMVSRHILDPQMTSSSFRDGTCMARNARPDLAGWAAQKNNVNQWIKVDLRIRTEVTGLRTFGGHMVHGENSEGWVSAFSIHTSLDGQEWTMVMNSQGHKQFLGNIDATTPVENMFEMAVRARYVRINPISWSRAIIMRFEILGCKQVCDKEIGSFPATRHVSSDNWFVVNAGEPFTCSGYVKAWKVIHAREEPLKAWVLRPVIRQPDSFLLIGSTYIPAGPIDKEVEYELDKNQQIPVQSGDVIGFLYDRNPLYSSEIGEETTDYLWVNIRDIPDYELMESGTKVRFTGGEGRRAFSAVAVFQLSNGTSVPMEGCRQELGLNIDAMHIPDGAFSASSHVKGHKPTRARLNAHLSHSGMRSGWTPRRHDRRPYLQVDLGERHRITGLITQGRDTGGSWQQHMPGEWRGGQAQAWVRSYFVQYSPDCENWQFVTLANGQRQHFEGNVNPTGQVTNYLAVPVYARCIRIQPFTCHHKIGVRLELLGSLVFNPCHNGGTRREAAGLNPNGFVCKCLPGWTGDRCEEVEGTCRSAGDSHYTTFDGRQFDFPGECTYTLSKCQDCVNEKNVTFDILSNNAGAGREIYILTNDMTFELKQEGVVLIEGEACKLPVKRNGVTVVHNAYTGVLLQTSYGLSVEFDGHHRVIINLPDIFAGKVQGLCGNFNGSAEDDIPAGESEVDFGQEFAVESDGCALPVPCDQNIDELQEVALHCQPILDPAGPFAVCQNVVNLTEIFEDCLQDVCRSSRSMSRVVRCTQLTELADLCAEKDIVITSWRKPDLCPVTCPAGMVYTPCGSACPATCGAPHAPKTCTKPCEETCVCPVGLLKEGKRCVPPSQCGCSDNGCYFQRGTTFYRSGCTERGVCEANGDISYMPSKCGQNATCGTRDGIYGCFCDDGFSGNGITCTSIQNGTADLVCDHEILNIYCGPKRYIDIVQAVYGRKENYDRCPTKKQPVGKCSAESAMSVTMAKCQGKETCSFQVTSEVFGDPCYGVGKYLEVDYECKDTPQQRGASEEVTKRVCQGDSMEIDCGDSYIRVVDAMYGRSTDGQVCLGGDMESFDCRSVSSLATVQRLCHNKNKCEGLQASNYLFGGNPCARTFKYLEVQYRCEQDRENASSDPCSSEPCKNGGTCFRDEETDKGYTCSCPHDWTGQECEIEEVTCRASGVSHILDFNERNFEFLGNSKYDFASSCHNNKNRFRVMIEKTRLPVRNDVTTIKAVHVHYNNKVLKLRQEYKVFLDGKRVSDTMTLNFGKIKLCRVGNYLLVKTDFDLIVAWDGLHRVQVRMPASEAEKTCGLCGTHRKISGENAGFIARNGSKVSDVNEFGSSWAVSSAPSASHQTSLLDRNPCDLVSQSARDYARDLCFELVNQRGIFKKCMGSVKSNLYFHNCMYDMCATLPSQEFLCQAVADYADACLDQGIAINWRPYFRQGQCAMVCPRGQMYSTCIQSCPKSCGDLGKLPDRKPVDRCYEGCVCREPDEFQDGDQCLTSASCGCNNHLGIYYKPESRVVNEHCTGQDFCLPGGNWKVLPLTCDNNAHCGVVDYRQGCVCNANYKGNGKQCFYSQEIEHKEVSQGEKLHIDCGDRKINIIAADYSYRGQSCQDGTTDPDCSSGNAADILANHVTQDGSRLSVLAAACHFGETCFPKYNVLTVSYLCSSGPVVQEFQPGKVVHIRACEGRLVMLQCREGSRINILSANYGRQTGSEVCPSSGRNIFSTNCRAPQHLVTHKLKHQCQGFPRCYVPVSKLGVNPCRGTFKYLDVTYKCEPFEPN